MSIDSLRIAVTAALDEAAEIANVTTVMTWVFEWEAARPDYDYAGKAIAAGYTERKTEA